MAQRARPATALAVAARFLNVEDWDPLPGMIKRQCPRCRYLFVDSEELRCPDCVDLEKRPRRMRQATARLSVPSSGAAPTT